jgi:hypothetical protein
MIKDAIANNADRDSEDTTLASKIRVYAGEFAISAQNLIPLRCELGIVDVNVHLSFTTWGGQARNGFLSHLSEMAVFGHLEFPAHLCPVTAFGGQF